MNWLYAIVFRMIALRPGALPAYHGDYARAALLSLIRAGNAPLAAALHDLNVAKPYAISLVSGGQRDRGGTLHFGTGDEAVWRFTLLYEAAFDAVLRRYILDRSLPNVRIGAISFAITDAFASANSHPDSGSIALDDLSHRWDRSPEALPASITLRFTSPTTFNLGQHEGAYHWHPLPEPRLVFSTLRKRWASLGGDEPGDSFDQWVADHVLIDDLNVRTVRVPVKKRIAPAFTGTVGYRVAGNNDWWHLAHLLTDLSFWTGVGYQTTYGLGQVRRVTKTEPVSNGL